MPARVRFVGERRDDIAAQLRLEEPSYDPAIVPNALLGHPQQLSTAVARVPVPEESWPEEEMMADYLIKRDAQWLATRVPALKGRTPREAASDPNFRPATAARSNQTHLRLARR